MQIAFGLFLLGLMLRLVEIHGLGRKVDLSPARRRPGASGWHTMFRRSLRHETLGPHAVVTMVLGYVFHAGLFVVLLLYIPHIELLDDLLGFGWPGLPSPMVDAITVLTLIALVATAIDRATNPIKRFLSNFDDWLSLLLTVLPLSTGYLAFHHLLLPYEQMLAFHILSAEVLVAALPFTKLVHAFTLWGARWYNGEHFGHKGVAS
jgi:nitrate reductase gamma subunit